MTAYISCYKPHVDKACQMDMSCFQVKTEKGGMYLLTKEYSKRFKMKNDIFTILFILHDIMKFYTKNNSLLQIRMVLQSFTQNPKVSVTIF
jgi:hypothetical protein